MKAEFNKRMEEQKRRVQELEESVLKSKLSYADALHNLEEISDEIHQRRKRQEERRALGTRGHGVGAENPEPSSKRESHSDGISHSGNDEYMELPYNLRLPKSSSSSTLSQMHSGAKSVDDRHERYSSRLRKSKSVADRSEVSPLFGRYSISRHNKLQVDHASQTDNDFRKTTLGLQVKGLKSDLLSPNVDINLDSAIGDISDNATSSSISSIQSSETTSPISGGTFGSVNRKGICIFPNTMATSLVGDSCDTSDTESLASIDVLSDEQIVSLMMDKDLELVANSLRSKVRFDEQFDVLMQQSKHRTTQTNTVAAECFEPAMELPDASNKAKLANAEITSPDNDSQLILQEIVD